MRNVRTAKGKKLDMAGLAAKHEEVRAISNVSMNARGDRLDKNGKVHRSNTTWKSQHRWHLLAIQQRLKQ